MLRANVTEGTPLGRVAKRYMDGGELVPDDVVIDMVSERLAQPDCQRGFVLDGFPRSLAQAEVLDRRLGERGTPLDVALYLDVPEAELFRRLAARARPDHDAQILRTRLRVFTSTTRPLVDHYDDQDLLVSVDGSGDVEQVTKNILVGPREVRTARVRRSPAIADAPERRRSRRELQVGPGASDQPHDKARDGRRRAGRATDSRAS